MNSFKAADPVRLEIIKNSLIGICEEMGLTLARSAYGLIFTEGRDFSCGIFDTDANLIVQGNFIPVHLAAMHFAVKMAVDEIGRENVHDGDVIMNNDPYCGGTHLPDVTLITPVFQDGELFAFVANRAHYTDVGGMSPGSICSDSKSIYCDGQRIPPIKIMSRGSTRDDVINLIISNM